jgi:hypothetical protein
MYFECIINYQTQLHKAHFPRTNNDFRTTGQSATQIAIREIPTQGPSVPGNPKLAMLLESLKTP